jgi:hypothetical protein
MEPILWTDERIDQLKARWKEGASAGVIAQYHIGVSRSFANRLANELVIRGWLRKDGHHFRLASPVVHFSGRAGRW